MIIARPTTPAEPDLLIGFENTPLSIHDLDGIPIASIPNPHPCWTHEALEALSATLTDLFPDGWDAYFQQQWVGSSEV